MGIYSNSNWRCNKCGGWLPETYAEVEIHQLEKRMSVTAESTYLCNSCFESFIVYFDNFMEEK